MFVVRRFSAVGGPGSACADRTGHVGAQAVTARFTGQRGCDALLMPVFAVLMTVISARHGGVQVRYGGPMKR